MRARESLIFRSPVGISILPLKVTDRGLVTQPRYAVAYVPRNNLILGIAYKFLPANVNLPWGAVKLDETPIEAVFRLMFEQTRVRALEARLLSQLDIPGGPVFVYYVTEFEGRPVSSQLGRAYWASERQLLLPTAEGATLSRRVLGLVHRV